MIDYARRGKAAKRKGAKGENEVRDLLREHGWDAAHRNLQSGGQGGGDLVDALDGWHIEIKRVEKLNLREAWKQANRSKRPTESALVAHRPNMQEWLATLLLTDMFGGLGAWRWEPRAIGPRTSVRAELYGRLHTDLSPMVVSNLGDDCVATVLLEDFLRVLAAVQTI